MTNFDQNIDRLKTESVKWHVYPPDVLPMWVADMDFRSPEPVIQALRERVDHGIFGYGMVPDELRAVICERLQDKYAWKVQEDALVFIPGVVTGFNIACRSIGVPGSGVLVQTPVYPPILAAPQNSERIMQPVELNRDAGGRYSINFEAFQAAIQTNTRSFLLCNPHNPTGRVFTQGELERMAEICLKHQIAIISDEIHCDLVYSEARHIPIASLSKEIEANTITLIAPSKTFNIAGLECSVAIIPNEELRKNYQNSTCGMVHGVNILGLTAGLAAYRDGEEWYQELMKVLEKNRNDLVGFIGDEMPAISTTTPEGTYLAWLDCRNTGIPGNPQQFFLEKAKVALNDGADFGQGGNGFVRFNFGTTPSRMMEALRRMAGSLKSI